MPVAVPLDQPFTLFRLISLVGSLVVVAVAITVRESIKIEEKQPELDSNCEKHSNGSN